MTLSDLERWLTTLLDLPAFERTDSSRNGLQVSRRSPDVRRVAFAVDASLESFRRAVEAGAGLLVVHHGILWDSRPLRLTGTQFERVRFLVEHDLALYAAHLPLDAHPEVGNNACIAGALGLVDVQPFGDHRGVKIGCKGRFPAPLALDAVISALRGRQGEEVGSLSFGPPLIASVGIVSGGAAGDVVQATAEGLDAFITGESSHDIYHHCLEARIHAIFCGHYHSESWGVQALAARLSRETGLETTYLDVPTGL
jgi:dinuclear metal center YbgI/SA1388 family protein